MSTVQPQRKPLAPEDYRYRSIGTIYQRPAVPIYIFEDILNEVIEYSERDQSREIGGFLIGNLCEDTRQQQRQYVEVRHFLPAKATESRVASLTFTHESWSAARKEIEEKYPDDRIVGWHHTHPGFGIFLSGYDLFIHRHYFSQPWEIALVVDPQANELGFFQWKGEDVVDCGFVCVFKSE
jgi:proteasome lid subunit RPN8/RPN11